MLRNALRKKYTVASSVSYWPHPIAFGTVPGTSEFMALAACHSPSARARAPVSLAVFKKKSAGHSSGKMTDTLAVLVQAEMPEDSAEVILVRGLLCVSHTNSLQAFVQGQNDPEYDSIVRAITAITFLATPHRGTHLAQTIDRILQSSIITSSKQYVTGLTSNSLILQKLNEQFPSHCAEAGHCILL